MDDALSLKFKMAKKIDLKTFLESASGLNFKKSEASHGGFQRLGWCPSCGAGRSDKLAVNTGWHCHACGLTGDVIDAAMHFYGLASKVHAVNKLLSEYAVQGVIPASILRDTPSKNDADRKLEAQQLAARYQAAAQIVSHIAGAYQGSAVNDAVMKYLVNERYIHPKTVKEAASRGFLISMPSDPMDFVRYLKANFPMELMNKSGLWKEGAKFPAIAYRPLMFVSRNKRSAEFRMLTPPPSPSCPKAMRLGEASWFYFKGARKGRDMVVEGPIDTLSAYDLGFQGDIFGLPGCNSWANWPDSEFAYLDDEVTQYLDCEADLTKNHGQQWALKLKVRLEGLSRTVFNRVPPLGSDLNDILKSRRLA